MSVHVKHLSMHKTALLLIVLICQVPFFPSQVNKLDSTNQFGLHLGGNFGAGFASGTVGGGLLKVCPRIGVNYKERFVLGLESNSDYQIVYLKNSSIEPSLRLIKWVGPFVRYYFYPAHYKLNLMASVNYVFGSAYKYSSELKYRETFNTAFLGLGFSYKVKHTQIEFGCRYTFLMNNTPILVRWTNSIFLGVTRNF